MKKKRLIIFLVVIFAVGTFLYMKPTELTRVMDYPVVNSYQDMLSQSSYVVEGHFTGFNYEWNMSRDENDYPSDIYETVGKVYNFQVNTVHKGDISNKEINVNQCYSDTLYYDTVMPDTSEIDENTPKVIVEDELYIEPDLTKNVILFLDYDETYKVYYAAVEPFMVSVDDNSLIINSNLVEGSVKNSIQRRS